MTPVSVQDRTGVSTPLLVAGGVLAAVAALRMRDPHRSGSWGLCPLRALTGLDCPFCGGLRAVNDLTHGHLAAAAASNLLLVASIPVLVVLWAVWLRSTGRPGLLATRPARLLGYGYVGVALAFTIWRNTPWGHALWA
jgi:hypothetical protein